MSYKVKLDVFEGPFDLLVYLIERAEMNIYDIQIAKITGQYVEYIGLMREYNVEVAGEFMVLAATLIEIKSKMLIPRITAEGTDAVLEDPREGLVQKILEYKKFKQAAEALENQEEYASMIFTKPQEDLSLYTGEIIEHLEIDIDQFVSAFQLFLMKKNRVEEVRKNYAKIERERLSVENRITTIKTKLIQRKKLSFEDLVEDVEDKYDIVLTFISILEIIKQNLASVKQQRNFGEITIMLKEEKERSIS